MAGVEIFFGLVGLVQPSIELCQTIVGYYKTYKQNPVTVETVLKEFQDFEGALESVYVIRKDIDHVWPLAVQEDQDNRIKNLRTFLFECLKILAVVEYKISRREFWKRQKAASFIAQKCQKLKEDLTENKNSLEHLRTQLMLWRPTLDLVSAQRPSAQRPSTASASQGAPSAAPPIASPTANEPPTAQRTSSALQHHDSFKFRGNTVPSPAFDVATTFHDDKSNEGRLKGQLLCENTRPCAYAVVGESGVGKSTTFFEIPTVPDLIEKFTGGFYYIKIGSEATQKELIDQIVEMTRKSGGHRIADEMQPNSNLENVVGLAANWFNQATILLLLDDISDERTFQILFNIISRSSNPSIVVYSTRELQLARDTASHIVWFYPKSFPEARKILIRCSNLPENEMPPECDRHIEYLVNSCHGLPVLLSINGRAVEMQVLLGTPDRRFEAWASYRKRHEETPGIIWDEREGKEMLRAFTAALGALSDVRGPVTGQYETLTYADMHQRLNIIRKQEWAPYSMLAILWGLPNQDLAGDIAKNLSLVNLSDYQEEKVKGAITPGIVLHNLAHDFAIKKETDAAREHAQKKHQNPDAWNQAQREHLQKGHRKLLDAYAAKYKLSNAEQGNCRSWWLPSLPNDGYIFANLSWHLYAAGLMEELKQLMLSAPWTIRQIRESGFSQFSQDYEMLVKLICKSSSDEQSVLRPLKTILDAASLASTFLKPNPDIGFNPGPEESGFQIFARLKEKADSCDVMKRYVEGIPTGESSVRVVPINECLTTPGGSLGTMIRCHEYVRSMIMLPDECTVICGCIDGGAFIVNAKKGIKNDCWSCHNGSLEFMVLNTIGTRMVTCGTEPHIAHSMISVWKTNSDQTPKLEYCLKSIGKVLSMALSSDGDMLICTKQEGGVDVWDLARGPDCLPVLKKSPHKLKTEISDICFLPKNPQTSRQDRVVSGGRDKTVRIWNLKTESMEGKVMRGHTSEINILCVSKDGTRIASAGKDKKIFLWDVRTTKKVGATDHVDHLHMVSCLSICKTSETRTTVVSGSADTSMRIWDFDESEESGEAKDVHCKKVVGHGGEIFCLALSSNGKELVSYSENRKQLSGMICMWDVAIARKTKTDHHSWGVQSLAVTPKHDLAISASLDKTLHIWNIKDGKKEGEPLIGHTGFVTNAVVTSDGEKIISGSWDATLRVWNLSTRTEIRKLKNVQLRTDANQKKKTPQYAVRSLAVSDDDEMAVCGSMKGRIHVWDLRPNPEVPCFQLQWDEKYDISFLHLSQCPVTKVRWLYVGGDEKISKWCLGSKKILDQKDNEEAGVVARGRVLEMFEDPGTSAGRHEHEYIKCADEKIICVEGKSEKVLARLESPISQWKITKDDVLCVGTESGLVAFLKIVHR